MKKIISLLILCLFAITNVAYANPPTKIDTEYNVSTKTLAVVVAHPVKDPQKHYIYKITLTLNGKEISKNEFNNQYNNTVQQTSFIIKDAKPGDVLIVEATCSIFGSLAKKITL